MSAETQTRIMSVQRTLGTLRREAEGMVATAKAAAHGCEVATDALTMRQQELDTRARKLDKQHGRVMGLAHALLLASRSGKVAKVAAAEKRLKVAVAADGKKVAECSPSEVLQAIQMLRKLAHPSSYENLRVVDGGAMTTIATWRGDRERHPYTLASFVLKWLLDEGDGEEPVNEYDEDDEDDDE